jgi:hypothetical protein
MAGDPVSGAVAGKPSLPKCKDCGKRTDRVVSLPQRGPNHAAIPEVRHEWLCADCEYLRENPDAPRFIKPPRERSKRLQKESLLDLLA